MPENSQNPQFTGSEERLRQIMEQRRGVEQNNEREIAGLVAQMKEAQQEVDTALSKLAYLSGELRGRAQRYPTESSRSYLVYANAHLRFAGAATQGMKRTAATSRLLDRAKAEQEEQKRREQLDKERQEAREKKAEIQRLSTPTEDAFSELYSEVVDHAD